MKKQNIPNTNKNIKKQIKYSNMNKSAKQTKKQSHPFRHQ